MTDKNEQGGVGQLSDAKRALLLQRLKGKGASTAGQAAALAYRASLGATARTAYRRRSSRVDRDGPCRHRDDHRTRSAIE